MVWIFIGGQLNFFSSHDIHQKQSFSTARVAGIRMRAGPDIVSYFFGMK